ncbi:MAG: DUF1129 domain-containing protein [Lactobacillaceae bacterium]|jgi:uncharacterized membrane-anchored protein|nr:DUF1129 domain-containing protein [Lactobacillaceae bacterium]
MTEEVNKPEVNKQDEEVQSVTILPTRADLAKSGLSKRNQSFVYDAAQLVTDSKKQAPLVADIAAQLLAGQKTGKTAKQLFGTPAEALGIKVKEANIQAKSPSNYAKAKFTHLAIDNTLTFLMLFSFMFGLTMTFSKFSRGANGGAAGITSLLLTSITGGLLFALVTKIMANEKMNRWKRLLGAVAGFIVWFAVYLSLASLPPFINPLLPGYVYIAIAAIAFLGFRAWRKKTGISGGFLGSASRNRKN